MSMRQKRPEDNIVVFCVFLYLVRPYIGPNKHIHLLYICKSHYLVLVRITHVWHGAAVYFKEKLQIRNKQTPNNRYVPRQR